MSKTRDTGYLANVIQVHDTGVRIMSGSTMLMAVSSSGEVTITGEMSGSDAANALLLDGTGSLGFAATDSFLAVSSSQQQISASLLNVVATSATTGSNTFTGAQFVSDTSNGIGFTSTASFYTDGGLRVGKNAYVSGTAYFNNIVVFGTSSIQYITSSQVNIGANIITVNTDTPAIRFGGLSVFDSGSTQLTGSLFWDSEKNHWIYSNPSGSSYNSGMIMSGPRNSGSLGDEQGTTFNALMKGQGGDHITSSQMFDDGTTVRIPGNLQVTGSVILSSALTGSSATFASTVNATDYYFNSTSVERAVKRYVSTANVSNAGYTVVCTVQGNSLASAIRITLQGTAGNTVINVTADILVNHSQDILISSQAGIYTVLTLRVKSNNDENFSVEVTSDSPSVCTMNVEVYPLNNETVTFGGSALAGSTLTHVCAPGVKISATGGSSGNLAASGDGTFGGTLGVSSTITAGGNITTPGSLVSNITNGYGLVLNRAAVTNYNGISLQTAGTAQWFVGMRENLSSNNYIIYNENGTDALTISKANSNISLGTTDAPTKLNMGGYVGSRLPYIDGTSKTFNSIGITVGSYNTGNAIGGGLDLTNNVACVGSYSPILSFSSLSSNSAYNNAYAGIWGVYQGAGGDANWNKGDLVFGTALSYGINERMRITGGGNVFIGTSSAVGTLQVIGTGTVFIIGESGGSAKQLLVGIDGSTGTSELQSVWQGNSYTRLNLNPIAGAVFAGATRLDTLSDARVKDNIQPITGALNKVLSITGKKFHLKDEEACKIRYGFIAQELEGVLDEFVLQTNMTFKKDDLEVENVKSIDNWASSWSALLVEAIKEQQCKISTLESCLGIA
jgi:hypothetical protein